jgi:tripartite ATP-independent transporter DctM subunit
MGGHGYHCLDHDLLIIIFKKRGVQLQMQNPISQPAYQLQIINFLEGMLNFFSVLSKPIRFLNLMGALALLFMMLISFADVLMRYFFNNPISGSTEITEILMVLMVFLAISYTQMKKGHVGIDLFPKKLPPSWQIVLSIVVNSCSLSIFALIAWRNFETALLFLERKQVTMELGIPIFPFFLVISLGCIMLCVVLLRDLLETLVQGLKYNLKKYHWLFVWISIIVLIGGSFLWCVQTDFQPTPFLTGIFFTILFILFLFTGMPIGFLLLSVAFLGLTNIRGIEASFSLLGTVLYRNTGSYGWSVFPLFVLMGYFCYFLDITRDLFTSAYKFLGRYPGGLAMSTIGACTAFGAISGDNGAGAATMGVVAYPELKKYGYDDKLALGSIVAGGTLEFLIPPSIGMILYGVLAEQSIPDLFMAGIVPGIISAILFCIYIYIICRVRPAYGPRGQKFTFREKIASLKNTWPVMLLFIVVIGGLYGGVFTPTEAGGVGATVALFIGVLMGRFNLKKISKALLEATRISAMVFTILGGAVFFVYFLSASQFTLKLANFVAALQFPPITIVICILFVFLLLGFFMPGSAVLLITIPIFLPIVKTFNFDLIWFGVLCVMMQNIGACTPPFGFVVYALKGVTPEVPIAVIFKGAMPFVFIMIIIVVLTIIFPKIATWLPYAFH